jgi:AcrR family transcriptional regulator
MEDKSENRTRILEESRKLFYNLGYKKVTMDDIARNMGMSKKTIYKYFDGKYEIMKTIVHDLIDDLSNGIDKIIFDEEMSYPAKLRQMLNFVALHLSRISPKLMEDLQINLPELWEEVNRYKRESAFKRFYKLIEEGKRKKLINDQINHHLIVVLYASAIQNLLDPEFLYQLPGDILNQIPQSPAQIFDNLVNIIYEGILTEETKIEFRVSK